MTATVTDGGGTTGSGAQSLPSNFFTYGIERVTLGLGSSSAVECYWDDIKFEAYTPGTPTGFAGTANTSSQITWSWTRADNNLFGFDVADGSGTIKAPQYNNTGWLTRSATSWAETGLAANTAYTREVRAWNGSLNSAYSSTVTKYTLAVAPTASNVTPDKSSPCAGETVTWSSTVFGAGVSYLRYAWDQSSTHTWTDTEAQWSSGTIQTVLSAPGTWYLHVRSYNGENFGNQSTTLNYPLRGFLETMGTVSATTAIATHEANNGFDNTPATMSGTADVRNTSASSGYAGASGGANVFISNVAGTENFQIADINSSGLANLQLSFGIWKSTTASSGSDLVLEVSSDGTTYTPLSFPALPTGSGTAIWHYRTATGTIPAVSDLRIRFRQTATACQYRIDDVKLVSAAPTATSDSPVLPGSTLHLYASTISGATYAWTGPNSFTSSDQNPEVSNVTRANNAGQYSVTATVNGCTSAAGTTMVVVNTPPTSTSTSASVQENTMLVLALDKLLGKAGDPDGDTPSVTAVSSPSLLGRTVSLPGDGTITYTAGPLSGGSSDSFTYTVSDNQGGTCAPTVNVTVTSGAGLPPNIVSPPTYADGKFSVTFAGIPGVTYTVEYAETSPAPPWTKLNNVTAGDNGLFVVEDTASESPSRYYRTVYPSY